MLIVELCLVLTLVSYTQKMFLLISIFFKFFLCSETLYLRKLDPGQTNTKQKQKQPEGYFAVYLKLDANRGHKLYLKIITVEDGENIASTFLSTKAQEERWQKLENLVAKIQLITCDNLVLTQKLLNQYLFLFDDKDGFDDGFIDNLAKILEKKTYCRFSDEEPAIVIRYDGLKTKHLGEEVYDFVGTAKDLRTTKPKSKVKSVFATLGRTFGRKRVKDQQIPQIEPKAVKSGNSFDSNRNKRSEEKKEERDSEYNVLDFSHRSDKKERPSSSEISEVSSVKDGLETQTHSFPKIGNTENKLNENPPQKLSTDESDYMSMEGGNSPLQDVMKPLLSETDRIYHELEEEKPQNLVEDDSDHVSRERIKKGLRQPGYMVPQEIFAH